MNDDISFETHHLTMVYYILLKQIQVREEIYQAFEAIYPVLTEFRKP